MCVLQGRQVFEHLQQLESRGVNLQIAVNGPQSSGQDTADLAATGKHLQTLTETSPWDKPDEFKS